MPSYYISQATSNSNNRLLVKVYPVYHYHGPLFFTKLTVLEDNLKNEHNYRNEENLKNKDECIILAICWLLFIRCYLLLVICYLPPVTCYLLLVTCYLPPVTCYLLLAICYLLLADTCNLILCILSEACYFLQKNCFLSLLQCDSLLFSYIQMMGMI